MKVLMLNPPFVDDFCRSARWAAKSRGRVQRHPDFLLIATAVLEQAGHEVEFIDGAAQNLKRQDVEKIIKSFKPDFTVCHTTTPSIYNDVEYARLAKKLSGCITALVGPHVTAEPEDTFRIAGDSVDAVVRGEYDYTLRDIADRRGIGGVQGVSFLDGKQVVNNKDRPLLYVNDLPFPAWHHIKPEWYRDLGKLYPFLTLISGRGCPNHCSFCRDTQLMYKRNLRLRDPEKVADEMESDIMHFPQTREIMMETDTFTANRSHVLGLCDEIILRKLAITWSCNVRVDVDLDMLSLMKYAGCRMLMVGFESGNQKILDDMDKGITLEQSREFAKKARKLGFTIHGCFMIGNRGETRETARETIEFAKSLPLDTVQFSGVCVYPGTLMYEWAKENGYLVPKDWREWVGPDCEQVTLLSYPDLPKKEIDELIDKGLKEFYLRPQQIARMALTTRGIGDLKRRFHGLKSFINYFT
ncbi:MAG: radical SAM protein [Methanobacteriota archaeon]